MDPELRKQVAIMLGQQAIEVVDHLLHIQKLEEAIADLRVDKIDVEKHRDQLEAKVASIASERDELGSLLARMQAASPDTYIALVEAANQRDEAEATQ